MASLVKKWIKRSDQKERKRLILFNGKNINQSGHHFWSLDVIFVAKWYLIIFRNYTLSFHLSVSVRSKYNMESWIHNLVWSISTLSTYIIPDWRPVPFFYFDTNMAGLMKKWIYCSDQKERKRLTLLNGKNNNQSGQHFCWKFKYNSRSDREMI